MQTLENLSSYTVSKKELEKHKLHEAAWEGNLKKVQRLAQPGQINSKDQHLRYLVHEGAKLNTLDHEQRTPLLKAVLSGNQNPQLYYQISKILLNAGADAFINAVDVHCKNALQYAIEFGSEELVYLFVQYPGCDPNFRDRDQMTALHLAIKRNNPNIVYILLSADNRQQADPNLINRNGQTALHIAAAIGSIDIIRILLQGNLDEPCDPTTVDSQQLTAYQIAKSNNHDSCAKLIAEYQNGWTDLTPRPADADESRDEPVLSDGRKRFLREDDKSNSDSH